MQIRPSVQADIDSISDVHVKAFGPDEGPEIATLVRDLFDDRSARPLFSFVATDEDIIAGHVLFTHAQIDEVREDISVQILAPLAVLPAYQETGIGSRLMGHGLGELKAYGIDLVFVLGHPGYYPRAGFRPAMPLDLEAPYPIPEENADAWMVRALSEGVIGKVKGRLRCSDVLNQPQHWRE